MSVFFGTLVCLTSCYAIVDSHFGLQEQFYSTQIVRRSLDELPKSLTLYTGRDAC